MSTCISCNPEIDTLSNIKLYTLLLRFMFTLDFIFPWGTISIITLETWHYTLVFNPHSFLQSTIIPHHLWWSYAYRKKNCRNMAEMSQVFCLGCELCIYELSSDARTAEVNYIAWYWRTSYTHMHIQTRTQRIDSSTGNNELLWWISLTQFHTDLYNVAMMSQKNIWLWKKTKRISASV